MKAYKVVILKDFKSTVEIVLADNEEEAKEYSRDSKNAIYVEDITKDCKVDLGEIESALYSFEVNIKVVQIILNLLFEFYDNVTY